MTDIIFGWGAEPLHVQLKGRDLNPDVIDQFQKDSEAWLRLSVRGHITDSEGVRIRGKIAKAIGAAIAKREASKC